MMKELVQEYNAIEERRSLIEGLKMRLMSLIPYDFLEQCPSNNAAVWLNIFTRLNRNLISVSVDTVKDIANEMITKYEKSKDNINTLLAAVVEAEEYNDRICKLMSTFIDINAVDPNVEVHNGDDGNDETLG